MQIFFITMSNIIDRIKQVIDYKGISERKFCKEIGVANGFLGKVNDVGAAKLNKILYTYSDINPVWLLTGEGEMLKGTYSQASIISTASEPAPAFGRDINDIINEILSLQRDNIAKGNRIIEQSDLINKMKEEIAALRSADGAARDIA